MWWCSGGICSVGKRKNFPHREYFGKKRFYVLLKSDSKNNGKNIRVEQTKKRNKKKTKLLHPAWRWLSNRNWLLPWFLFCATNYTNSAAWQWSRPTCNDRFSLVGGGGIVNIYILNVLKQICFISESVKAAKILRVKLPIHRLVFGFWFFSHVYQKKRKSCSHKKGRRKSKSIIRAIILRFQ